MIQYQSNQFKYTVIYKDCTVEFGYTPSITVLIEELDEDGRLDMVAQLHLDMEVDE